MSFGPTCLLGELLRHRSLALFKIGSRIMSGSDPKKAFEHSERPLKQITDVTHVQRACYANPKGGLKMQIRKTLTRRLFQSLVLMLTSLLVLSACDLFAPPEPATCETQPSAETCFPENGPDDEVEAADFTLSSTVDSQEAGVGDTLTFTFTVENVGAEAGEATLSVPATAGFDADPLEVSISLGPGEDTTQVLEGTVLETAGETLAVVANLSVAATGNVSKSAQVNIVRTPAPPRTTKGAVILTFDDNFTDNWLAADEALADYDWKATFFITGGEDAIQPRLSILSDLQDRGHEIGAHTISHTNIEKFAGTVAQYMETDVLPNLELLEEGGLTVSSFAYAEGATTSAFDDALFERFTNLRGIAPTSTSAAGGRFYVTEPGKLPGLSIDERSSGGTEGTTEIDYIFDALAVAQETDEALVIYGHNIVDGTVGDIPSLGLTLDRLEQIVKYVAANNMEFLTMSDLETWQAGE